RSRQPCPRSLGTPRWSSRSSRSCRTPVVHDPRVCLSLGGREWRVPYAHSSSGSSASPRAPLAPSLPAPPPPPPPPPPPRPPSAPPFPRLSRPEGARSPIEPCPDGMFCAPGAHKSEPPPERLQGRCPFRCPRRCAAVAGLGRV